MSAAASLAKSGKLILVISIVVFIAALVVLLMTAGLSVFAFKVGIDRLFRYTRGLRDGVH